MNNSKSLYNIKRIKCKVCGQDFLPMEMLTIRKDDGDIYYEIKCDCGQRYWKFVDRPIILNDDEPIFS